MNIQVQEAGDEDMARIFEICSLAFQHNEPFWDTCWPHHDTEAGRRRGADGFTKTKHSDPHTTYLKAFDSSTGKIAGMAKWLFYENHIPEDKKTGPPDDYPGNEDDKAYLEAITKEFKKERNAAIERTNGNLASLDILTVDPTYQRKGAGKVLVKWGVDKADQLGLEAVVESSPFGKALYEKNGFVFVKNVRCSLEEPFADREAQEFAWLVRPKKA